MEAKLVWNPIECVLLGCWAGNGDCEMNTRRGRRAAVGMGGRANNRDEGEASWEDVQAAGGSEAVEQRDGLTPRGFQGTCSVWFRLRTDTLRWRCESTPAIPHQTHKENREQVWTCMWMCVCVCLASSTSACLHKSAGGHRVLAVLPKLKIIKRRGQMSNQSYVNFNFHASTCKSVVAHDWSTYTSYSGGFALQNTSDDCLPGWWNSKKVFQVLTERDMSAFHL